MQYETTKVNVDNMPNLGDVAGCNQKLSEMVQQSLKDGRRVLTIGGDHSIGIGSIDGHVKVIRAVLFFEF